MRKAIALVKDDRKLQAFLGAAERIDADFNQRHDFIMNAAKKLREESSEVSKKFYERVEEYAREKGILPDDYNPKKGHHLEFDAGKSCLRVCYECNQSRGNLGDFLARLFT